MSNTIEWVNKSVMTSNLYSFANASDQRKYSKNIKALYLERVLIIALTIFAGIAIFIGAATLVLNVTHGALPFGLHIFSHIPLYGSIALTAGGASILTFAILFKVKSTTEKTFKEFIESFELAAKKKFVNWAQSEIHEILPIHDHLPPAVYIFSNDSQSYECVYGHYDGKMWTTAVSLPVEFDKKKHISLKLFKEAGGYPMSQSFLNRIGHSIK